MNYPISEHDQNVWHSENVRAYEFPHCSTQFYVREWLEAAMREAVRYAVHGE